MDRRKVLFIGKGGKKEGMGHLVRIATLADEFAPHYDITILVQQDRFGESFFKRRGSQPFTYSDNQGMYRFLEKTGKYRVIIIDIYRIAIDTVKKIENYCDLLINFDDMQRRVPQPIRGLYICPQEPFNSKVYRKGTPIIAAEGTDYFPLRKEFVQYREKKDFQTEVKNIGICLGGVPEPEETLELIQMLDRFPDKQINLHVVMGYKPEGADTAAFSKKVHFYENVDNMAGFIAGMDVGIIAGGFIKFEFMCIGTPFLLVSRAKHQQELARKFSAEGYGVYLGTIDHVLDHPERFARKIGDFLRNQRLRKIMFENSRRLVDGKGSSRILKLVDSQL